VFLVGSKFPPFNKLFKYRCIMFDSNTRCISATERSISSFVCFVCQRFCVILIAVTTVPRFVGCFTKRNSLLVVFAIFFIWRYVRPRPQRVVTIKPAVVRTLSLTNIRSIKSGKLCIRPMPCSALNLRLRRQS
jgi:hypothetical protein